MAKQEEENLEGARQQKLEGAEIETRDESQTRRDEEARER
jgi:hypothetical protein